MNNITIIGNACRDPESKMLDNGTKVTTINLASNIRKKGDSVTMFYRVVLFGNYYDNFLEYIKKGSSLVVNGSLQEVKTYQSKDGEWKPSLEVIASSISFNPASGKRDEESTNYSSYQQAGNTEIQEGQNKYKAVPMNEELPF